MGGVCNGICPRYEFHRTGYYNPGIVYKIGGKRCQVCELYIKWSGRLCPCCGVPLRYKPRYGKTRNKDKVRY